MSLTEDLAALADMAATLSAEANPDRAIVALELLAIVMPDLIERARLLENRTVPPHWRRQAWDSSAYRPNIVPLRGR